MIFVERQNKFNALLYNQEKYRKEIEMMKRIMKMFMMAVITIVVASIGVNFNVAHAQVEKIVVGNEELVVCSTAYPYTFIVIWEDPEGLDILSYPWTGVNNGIESNVVYRLAYGERFLVNGVVRNNRDNVFLRLEDGNYVYSGDCAFDFDLNGERLDGYHSDNMGEFYLTFLEMNKEGGVMDVKLLDPSSKKIPYMTYYGLENRLVTKTAEQLGNEMYGYVGSKIGINRVILGTADLLANLSEGKFSLENYLYSYNDDPEDADSIDEGIEYFYRTH